MGCAIMSPMATINKQLAGELVRGGGKYRGDKRACCVVMYQNRTKYDLPGVDLYDPEAPVNCFDYAVFYDRGRYLRFLDSDTVGGVTVLWGSEKFHKEEAEAVLREESEEFTSEALVLLGVDDDDMTIDEWLARNLPEGDSSTRSRRRK